MNYDELQQIVRYVRKNMHCQQCNKPYMNYGIEVLSTFDDQGLFHLNCHHCKHQVLIHVTITEDEAILTQATEEHQQKILGQKALLNERKHRAPGKVKDHVSINDVIDIHSFLSEFNGDFKSLFSNKQV